MLTINHLSAAYDGKTIINNLSLHASPGQLTTCLGPSGAGKSTLLKTIAGLHPLKGGHISLKGRLVDSQPAEHRGMVYLSQEPSLFPHMTVYQNMAFGMKLQKHSKTAIREKITELMSILGLQGLDKRKPYTLSGGQRQRVAMGRALAIQPQVLLLDEPFSSLDLDLRQTLGHLIRRICDHYKVIILMVTHDPKEALALSDQILLMDQGDLLQCGSPQEVYRQPACPKSAGMLGPWATHDQRFYRPEDVSLVPSPSGHKVVKAHKKGLQVVYTLEGPGGFYTLLTTDIFPLDLGQRVQVVWRTQTNQGYF